LAFDSSLFVSTVNAEIGLSATYTIAGFTFNTECPNQYQILNANSASSNLSMSVLTYPSSACPTGSGAICSKIDFDTSQLGTFEFTVELKDDPAVPPKPVKLTVGCPAASSTRFSVSYVTGSMPVFV
jgi:hypothetical protein